MHVQAPTVTIPRRTPLVAGAVGLASAAIAAGVIAISNGDDSSKPVAPVKPAVVQSSPGRVWDGSPLLRGTESTPGVVGARQSSADRVWDGSPLLRGTTLQHSGGPSVKSLGSASPNLRFRAGRPESFHTAP